ncbi:response regulator [Lederbergia wuyishanensis]|uniref:Two-component system response regulator YesN n=1 Tax=Lederbergia wuyishanensis TaxID=1347903 RepID=A0ABU0D4W3_9BACI|nr:response regulator [Lederbergia wuyishanensis]MCJ8009529.1 response regulator [Lederbergia wuyishanensis]MDQ0343434.1 two-component system response regulator YesN [Lederbergia wuyishanensis]
MYQLLLVDDEQSIVETLSLTIPWDKIGVINIFKAYSAYEALDILSENSIDIVITDIKMPGMSGIQLIEEIKHRFKHIKCVLLSGFDDFAYAQQAIKFGTSDYLLKPVKDEELIDTVRRLVIHLDEEWDSVASNKRVMSIIKNNSALLKRNLLAELLSGMNISKSLLMEKLELLEIPTKCDDQIYILHIHIEEIFHNCTLESNTLIQFSIENIAEQILSDVFQFWSCSDNYDDIIYVVKHDKEENINRLIRKSMIAIQDNVQKDLGCRVSVFLSKQGIFPYNITELYQDVVAKLRSNSTKKIEEILEPNEMKAQKNKVYSLQTLYQAPSINQLLDSGLFDRVKEKLNSIFVEVKQERFLSKEYLYEVFYSISSAYIYIAHKYGKHLSYIIEDDIQKITNSKYFTSDEIKKWAFITLEKIIGIVETEQKGVRFPIVKQVHIFIEENLDKDVSLQKIAEHVYLHPVYLSKIYKIETGEGLSDFIYKYRMKQASKYLINSNRKINEIGKSVGYQNTSYFIKVFKDFFGMTPQEYRNGRYKNDF